MALVVGSAEGEGNAVVASDSCSGAVSLLSRRLPPAHSAVEPSEALRLEVPCTLCPTLCPVRAQLSLAASPSRPAASRRLMPCGKVAPVSGEEAATMVDALDEVGNGDWLCEPWHGGCGSSAA